MVIGLSSVPDEGITARHLDTVESVVKDTVEIHEYAKHIGVKIEALGTGWWIAKCPFCSDCEVDQSFCIYPCGELSEKQFYCNECGRMGNVIDLCMMYEKYSMRWMATLCLARLFVDSDRQDTNMQSFEAISLRHANAGEGRLAS